MKTSIRLWYYIAHFLLELEIFQKNFEYKFNAQILG